jgi:hypothetical protein
MRADVRCQCPSLRIAWFEWPGACVLFFISVFVNRVVLVGVAIASGSGSY